MKTPILLVAAAFALLTAGADTLLTNLTVTCERYEPQTTFSRVGCWAPDGLVDGEGGVYVFLEQPIAACVSYVRPLMEEGRIPKGIVVAFGSGVCSDREGRGMRGMRAVEFDSVGPEFPSAIAEEIVPFAARALGVKVSDSPDRHFITGASSGGIAAFNACWYRNDYFRRCYCNSPTFSNIRGGNALMPLVRKSETRPIRVWISVGTDEPDYFFGDSYFVAADAAAALRFAGYEVRYDRLLHEDHGARYWNANYQQKVLTWLFEDWQKNPVAPVTNPIRVRNLVVKGKGWTESDFRMPAPRTECLSTDGWRVYSVDPTNRFVMACRQNCDGSRDQISRLAPLELPWNVSCPGGRALALLPDDRLLVATELGVQGVVPFGIADLVLPLPSDLPCDNVAVVGDILYAASGSRVFSRPINIGSKRAPGYDDGFWYSREHAPEGEMAEMLDSYVSAGRIAGVVSVLSDPDYNVRIDCAGWARDFGRRSASRMTGDTLFAIFSMTKTFTGAAIMCAIDEGKISLDDEVSKYLPEFADVRMKDGSRPKRALLLRDIMCHQSGFRFRTTVINRDKPLREVARELAAQPLEFQPGETFRYGNGWICTGAACLEIAVGEPFEKYLQRKILDPLGMTDTTFFPTEDQLKRLVSAYNSDDTPLRLANDQCARQLVFPKEKPLYPAASGGLFSTPNDMIRFSQMLAHHGTWKDKVIISRKTFDAIFARKQTDAALTEPYTCGSWLYGDWFGHEGAMRTDQRANLRTGHSRVFFIQTENAAGSAFFQLKRDWHYEADKIQGTPATVFGN